LIRRSVNIEEKILSVLDYENWKSSVAIAREIGFECNAPSGFFIALERLVKRGEVEARDRRLTPKELAARGGRPGLEFRLKRGGLKRKVGTEKKGFGFGRLLEGRLA
jgi:hypothetical protein